MSNVHANNPTEFLFFLKTKVGGKRQYKHSAVGNSWDKRSLQGIALPSAQPSAGTGGEVG